jgi:hypothetical protein
VNPKNSSNAKFNIAEKLVKKKKRSYILALENKGLKTSSGEKRYG